MALNEMRLNRLFEAQTEKTSNELAIVSQDGDRTISELDRESEALGSYLRQHGVLPDDQVGIFMETCSNYIVSCIGALKAGGAFMPLALESPDNLLNTILKEAKPKVVITKKCHLPRLSSYADAHVLLIVGDRTLNVEAEPQSPSISPHNLAFVPWIQRLFGRH